MCVCVCATRSVAKLSILNFVNLLGHDLTWLQSSGLLRSNNYLIEQTFKGVTNSLSLLGLGGGGWVLVGSKGKAISIQLITFQQNTICYS